MSASFDPEVLQDFVTESGELLDQLDADLVSLESAPDDPELTNQAFRALHTIKGSASFLALAELVEIAHAAEDALNAARKGQAAIDRRFMDLLLDAVDIIRGHMDRLRADEPLEPAPEAIVRGLRAIGASENVGEGSAPVDAQTPADPSAEAPLPGDPPAPAGAPLELPESKADLLSFMVEDLRDGLHRLTEPIAALGKPASREEATHDILEICEGLVRTTEFFEFKQMADLVGLLALAAEKAGAMREQDFAQLIPRLEGIVALLSAQAAALEQRRAQRFSIDALSTRVLDIALGNELDANALLLPDADGDAALKVDGAALEPAPAQDAQQQSSSSATPPADDDEPAAGQEAAAPRSESAQPAADQQAPRKSIDQTIRVEVDRLESLQNLVGELVLQKNRLAALSRAVSLVDGLNQDVREAIKQSTGDLDRVTSDIQVAVMRTRMQPLDKLFGRYPRLIRDLARKTSKQIELVIQGGQTEVDKSVLEALNDPLVHLLRNAADHGVEAPEQRRQAGKPETGRIWLTAAHEGGNVRVAIRDDGAGLSRERIARKAVERGLASEEEIATLADKQVHRFIFAPGFSTADQVSDLSGRGVGMDVVRTNIENVKGRIDVDAEPGKGTTVSIIIPLTVAIMPAMMVAVGEEKYAVPLSNILRIVRPEDEQVATVGGKAVLRLRGAVIPLMSLSELFDSPMPEGVSDRFVVVAGHNDQRVGLLVTGLLGQQEIVIKPLDASQRGSGPVSGATIRDDGGVSLIVDVAKVISSALSRAEAALA